MIVTMLIDCQMTLNALLYNFSIYASVSAFGTVFIMETKDLLIHHFFSDTKVGF